MSKPTIKYTFHFRAAKYLNYSVKSICHPDKHTAFSNTIVTVKNLRKIHNEFDQNITETLYITVGSMMPSQQCMLLTLQSFLQQVN